MTGMRRADRRTLRAAQVMQLLDRLYTKFDQLVAQYELFKVETIGAYLWLWPSVDPEAGTTCLTAIGQRAAANNTHPGCACNRAVTMCQACTCRGDTLHI